MAYIFKPQRLPPLPLSATVVSLSDEHDTFQRWESQLREGEGFGQAKAQVKQQTKQRCKQDKQPPGLEATTEETLLPGDQS